MAKQRIVNTHFWRDNFILGLRPDERLLFLWVITNPATDLCGAYEAAMPTIELETGLKAKRIREIFDTFEASGKILYRDGWVIIRNFTKHQNGTSTNVKKGAERSLNACPDWVKDTLSRDIHTDPNQTLPRPRPKPRPEPRPKPEPSVREAALPQTEPEPLPVDDRINHPAIVAIHAAVGIYPPREIWNDMIERMGVDVDIGKLKTTYAKWRARGYNKTNYDGFVDWYTNGIPEQGKKQNGSNQRDQGTSGNRATTTDRLAATADIISQYPSEAELGRQR